MPQVAIIGRPNVGKSTLFNRLTKAREALVHATPGLTRDRKYGLLKLNGYSINLVDTGGVEGGNRRGEIGVQVYEQSLLAAKGADLIIFVVDGREGLTALDKEIFESIRPFGKPLIVVANKIDYSSLEKNIHEFYELGVPEIIPISAEHGKGINALTEAMLKKAQDLGWEQREEEKEYEAGLIKVAIVGRPNVGKSSLFNRLVGEKRMIVTDVPGTTRDVIDTLIERGDKKNILLTDTAGIRKKARVHEKVEKFSIVKAMEVIKECDIALTLLDASEGITVQDQHLIGYAHDYGRGIITLYNKWDLIKGDTSLIKIRKKELEIAKRFVAFSPHLNISALTGKNVKKIFPLIDEVFNDFNMTVTTGRANNILQKAMELRSPPISKGRPIKLFYTTQVSTRPPAFLIFTNSPKLIPEYYKRFLINQFRDQAGLRYTPIRIIFRMR